jgi:hypothetical protein
MTEEPLQYSDYHIAVHEPEARCKPWPQRLHCRRRSHRAFLQWYAENRENFAIDLELLKRTDTRLHIGFRKISQIITATLAYDAISIAAVWDGHCWDMLHFFETYPKRVPNGYVCDQCPENDRPVFSSREALWRAEVFEPFLEWVNRDLANAVAVSISGTPNSFTWAGLVVSATGPQQWLARVDGCEPAWKVGSDSLSVQFG